MHSIELKFGMYIAGHHWTNPIDFGEYQMYSFFTGVQERILIQKLARKLSFISSSIIEKLHISKISCGKKKKKYNILMIVNL